MNLNIEQYIAYIKGNKQPSRRADRYLFPQDLQLLRKALEALSPPVVLHHPLARPPHAYHRRDAPEAYGVFHFLTLIRGSDDRFSGRGRGDGHPDAE